MDSSARERSGQPPPPASCMYMCAYIKSRVQVHVRTPIMGMCTPGLISIVGTDGPDPKASTRNAVMSVKNILKFRRGTNFLKSFSIISISRGNGKVYLSCFNKLPQILKFITVRKILNAPSEW